MPWINVQPPSQIARAKDRATGLLQAVAEVEEEGIVPSGTLDLLAHGDARRAGSDDVEGEAAKDGEILRPMVVSGPVGILVEVDVEYPLYAVLVPQWLRTNCNSRLADMAFAFPS